MFLISKALQLQRVVCTERVGRRRNWHSIQLVHEQGRALKFCKTSNTSPHFTLLLSEKPEINKQTFIPI